MDYLNCRPIEVTGCFHEDPVMTFSIETDVGSRSRLPDGSLSPFKPLVCWYRLTQDEPLPGSDWGQCWLEAWSGRPDYGTMMSRVRVEGVVAHAYQQIFDAVGLGRRAAPGDEER